MATTPIFFPSALKAMSRPRMQVPDSGQSRALEAGLGAGVSALGKVAEIWRDRENFQAQSEQMAQALEREGMTQEAGMYRSAAQSATTNFFTDPATNRKAQQGLLSDALKLLSNKQENDLRKELGQMNIDAQIAADTRKYGYYDRKESEERLARIRARNLDIDAHNKSRGAGEPELPHVSEDANIDVAGMSPMPSPLPKQESEARRISAETGKLRLELARDEFEFKKNIRQEARDLSEQFKIEIQNERQLGKTVEPHGAGGIITGYDVIDPNTGKTIRRAGEKVIRLPDGSVIVEKDDVTTTTTPTRPEGTVGPSSPLLQPGEYIKPPTRANENPILPPPIQDSGF